MKSINNFYKNKKILITGGTGLIGLQLVNYLSGYNAKIHVASLDGHIKFPKNIRFYKTDLRDINNCIKITKNIDYVFHLAGVKGSPLMASIKQYEFMIPMLMFNTNMIEACRINNIKKFLFTSSIGVYQPANKLNEDDVWRTFPSTNDWYAGWAKRIGELSTSLLKNKKIDTFIVRPANVFGPYDNFNKNNSMVIPSLISKFLSKNNEVKIWGDGTNIRDFVYSKDVARAMLHIMRSNIREPINIGSGKSVTIKYLANLINKLTLNKKKVKWVKTATAGDKIRLMNISKLERANFKFEYSLEEGLKETINWYKNNNNIKNKYNAFEE
jgi:GDP-L-fucose synthase